MKSAVLHFVLMGCSLFLTGVTGCASMGGYSGKTLYISSKPNGATVTIYDRTGEKIQETITPASVYMNGKSPFRIEITKNDYEKAVFEVKKGFNSAYWDNIPAVLVGGIGLVGLIYDPLVGAVIKLSPNPIDAKLSFTPEALAAQEARRKIVAEEQARITAEKAEAERLAAEERQRQKEADAAIREAKFNPNKLDRSQYREIKAEDFSFDMVAGRLAVGTKVVFSAKFWTKPTGTNYRFENVNSLITLSTTHNFVRDMPDICFEGHQSFFYGGWLPQTSVKIFVTVKRTGQSGECSVDIVEW
jgi:hypothetical protein